MLGKIPARGDFVRLNAAGAGAEALFDWLQMCLERQMRDGNDMAPMLATFVFPVESAGEVLLGVLVDSRDKVGRAFPLVIYQPIPLEGCVGGLAALLHATAGRIEAIKSLLAERDMLDPAALAERAGRLSNEPIPDIGTWDEEFQKWSDNVSAGVLSEFGFTGLASDEARTALLTFLEACRPLAGRRPPRNPIVLDCPVASAEGAYFWIELAERVLSWNHVTPGVLISNVERPRLLLSLGPLPAFSFSWLRKPEACRSRVLALTQAAPSTPSGSSPELEQMGTLSKFFASLRPSGTP